MDEPERAKNATRESKHENAPLEWATRAFETIEHFISVGIGIILIIATILVLAGTAANLLHGLREWPETTHAFEVVDKLLFVLMLVEILHTVRASIQSMKLAAEPFLIVGLIASVRRILVVTLEASGVSTGDGHPSPPFEHAMIELGVLAVLTLVLIVSLYLARRSEPSDEEHI